MFRSKDLSFPEGCSFFVSCRLSMIPNKNQLKKTLGNGFKLRQDYSDYLF